jgi:Zn-dependent peptidase ImmA (M78 family)/DNA-binding XRE family transcriptional regulator
MNEVDQILNAINPEELGKRLRLAREQRGMKQEEAANLIQVARTTLVAIEQGKRRVRPEEIVELVFAYGRDLTEFVRLSSYEDMFTEPQFRGPEEYEDPEDAGIEQWIQELKALSYDYYEYEQMLNAPLIRKYPVPYEVNTNLEPSEIGESIAIEERQRFGLGDGPIPLLRDLLEQEVGLRLYYLPIEPSKFSAFYLFSDRLGPCIAVNSQMPEDRCRLSTLHEYGHFLTQRYKPDIYIDGLYPYRSLGEKVADAFAAHFLMPTSGVTRRVNDIRKTKGSFTPYDLVGLAHYYGASFSAMSIRLEQLKLIPAGFYQNLLDQGFKVRKVQKELGLGELPANRSRLPLRHRLLAAEAYDADLISESRFAGLLQVDRLSSRVIAEKLNNNGSFSLSDLQNQQLLGSSE